MMAGGIYGDFLGYFSELFEDFEVFTQTPDTVSGYSLSPARTVRGIRQSNDTSMTGNRPKTLPVVNITPSFMLWTYEPIDMATEFVRIDGRMFRAVKEGLFNREGGFYETVLEALAGNDGTKSFSPELTEGVFG